MEGLESPHAADRTVKWGGPSENGLAGPQDVKYTITTWPRDSIPIGIAPRNLKMCTNQILYARWQQHYSKSPSGKRASANWGRQNVVCPHNGILLSHKKARRDLPSGPVAKILCAQGRRPGFSPWSGNSIPPATTKVPICHNQDLAQPDK